MATISVEANAAPKLIGYFTVGTCSLGYRHVAGVTMQSSCPGAVDAKWLEPVRPITYCTCGEF